MKIIALLVIAIAIAACSQKPPPAEGAGDTGVGYWHDDVHHVSCWLYGNGPGSYTAAISCLRD